MRKICLTLLFGSVIAFSQAPPRNYLSEGEAAFRAGKYAQAIQLFEQAATAAPSDPNPHFYMAAAYVQQITPGTNTPENQQFARNAERELQAVLSLQPDSIQAMQSLATLHSNLAAGKQEYAEKMRSLDESAYWYRKIVGVQPNNKVAHYGLGVIAWLRSYPEVSAARQRLGMKADAPGPLPNAEVRSELRSRFSATIQEGIHHLDRALEIDPSYLDAMSYMNLLHRQQAGLADSSEEYTREIQVADSFVQRAMKAKRSGGVGNAPSGTMAAPAPPPPPPPPAPTTGEAGAQLDVPKQIRVGAEVQASKLINRPEPQYPPLAVQARIQGTVRFTVVIDPQGVPSNITLNSGHPLLVPAATDALRQYRYQPTLLSGQPVEVLSSVDVNFNLP